MDELTRNSLQEQMLMYLYFILIAPLELITLYILYLEEPDGRFMPFRPFVPCVL